MPGVLSALPIVGNIVDSILGGVARRKQRKHEFALSEYAYSKDLEQWKRQNEYNLPTNVMQRFEDAGINPNLIAGQAGSWGKASEMPSYQAPRAEYQGGTNFATALGLYNDFRQKNAQVDNLHQLNRSLSADADLKELERDFMTGEMYPIVDSKGQVVQMRKGKRYNWFRDQEYNLRESARRSNLSKHNLQISQDRLRKLEIDMFEALQKTNWSGTKFEEGFRDFFRMLFLRK